MRDSKWLLGVNVLKSILQPHGAIGPIEATDLGTMGYYFASMTQPVLIPVGGERQKN